MYVPADRPFSFRIDNVIKRRTRGVSGDYRAGHRTYRFHFNRGVVYVSNGRELHDRKWRHIPVAIRESYNQTNLELAS